MQIIQLVVISVSIIGSFQEDKNLVPEELLNVSQSIVRPPEVGLNIYQILQKHGYAVETHSVITEDGYILRMHRIPRGRNETENGKSKPAILLIHGMFSSSADWLLMGPGRSLAYMLADSGFDVWLGNNRGNTWSRNHVRLDPSVDVKEFWDFSFEDCGRYDLPAKIDFIIEKTGQDKIFYIGHSQGTTEYFAMATLRPEYNDKIALMLAFAPVAYLERLTSPLPKLASRHMKIITTMTDILNIHECFGHSKLLTELLISWCSDGSPLQETCVLFLFFLCGFNYPELEKNLLPVLGSSAPAGASLKMMVHYGQEVNSGYFRQYDYGKASNLIRYNTTVPPNFNLSAATAPIALYYGKNDYFAAVEISRAKGELERCARVRKKFGGGKGGGVMMDTEMTIWELSVNTYLVQKWEAFYSMPKLDYETYHSKH